MDQTTLITAAIIAFIVWAIVLGYIIESASRSKKIEQQLKIQTVLLAKIAQKHGVPDDEINNIISLKKGGKHK